MAENKINAAIQLLPSGEKAEAWHIVDLAIEQIAKSGLNYKVCPFETVVEGSLHEITLLIEDIRELCYKSGVQQFILNLKLQFEKNKDVFILDKMKKYQDS